MASIIDGVYEIIDEALGVIHGKRPHYAHKKSCLELCEAERLCSQGSEGILKLLLDMYSQIESNWDPVRQGSKENWRWDQKTKLTNAPKHPEVTLERLIVSAFGEHGLWTNQVPTSSGLAGSGDRARSIDLVRQDNETEFTFFELKVGSNNPTFAAIEILIYGLIYCFTRANGERLATPDKSEIKLLNANKIHLRVLAPSEFYGPYVSTGLKAIADEINYGLGKFMEAKGLVQAIDLDFAFEEFAQGFSGDIHGVVKDAVKLISPVCK